MDSIEAFPLLGEMVKDARNGMCDMATMTSGGAAMCKGWRMLQTSNSICEFMMMANGMDAAGCAKMAECFVGNPWEKHEGPEGLETLDDDGSSRASFSSCIEGFSDIIEAGIERGKEKFETMGDALFRGSEEDKEANVFGLKRSDFMRCQLTRQSPIDIVVNGIKHIYAAINNMTAILKGMSQTMDRDNCTWSVLHGMSTDFQFKAVEKSEEIGVYITMTAYAWKGLSAIEFDKERDPDMLSKNDLLAEMLTSVWTSTGKWRDSIVIGIYSASGVSASTYIKTEVDSGPGFQVLQGGADNWGGYGYEVGLSLKHPAPLGIEMDLSLVFSARASDNQVNRIIGFGIWIEASAGISASSISGSVGCGLATTVQVDFEGPHVDESSTTDATISLEHVGTTMAGPSIKLSSTCDSTTQYFQAVVEKQVEALKAKQSDESTWRAGEDRPGSAEWEQAEKAKCAEALKCMEENCEAELQSFKDGASTILQKCSQDFSWTNTW
jgi:hypothetical protein